jgi:predicted acetyltransferase
MLVGATAEAERELWRHLCDLDWIATVTAEGRPVDEPLRHLLVDGRAAVAFDHWDNIWSRVLDVPAAFGAFRPPTEREATLEVVDPAGYATGRWHLHLGPAGAEVTTTTRSADVRLPVDALGAIHLGGTSPANLRDAGWLDEEQPGGVDRVAALFATPSAPWSPTHY